VYVRPRYRVSARSPRGEARPSDPSLAPAPERRRSHAAVIPSLVLLGVGVWLGTITILFEGILAVVLLGGAFTLLGSRLNPLSIGFYLSTKPSWTAIGTVFVSGWVLLAMTYIDYVRAWGPVLPHWGGL
jgi:hypothetical protein